MSSESGPRNRKERRAAAKEGRAADSIPMAQPDRTKPKGKTLFELAAEKEAALRGRSQPSFSTTPEANGEPSVVTINPDGSLSGPDGETLSAEMTAQIKASMEPNAGSSGSPGDGGDETAPGNAPMAESILYILTLCVLHFTFTVVVAHQYGMSRELPWTDAAWKTLQSLPTLMVVVFTLHPRANAAWAQGLFLAISIASGCWLIHASSNMPYMAVMKRAPGAGTIWIWSALESRVEVALAGALAVGVFYWYGNYNLF